MSVRGPSTRQLPHSRLYDVLHTGLQSGPSMRPRQYEVHTSEGSLIGIAEQQDAVYVFVSPSQLRGVRVHPPFTVQGADRNEGVVSAVAGVLSEALGR